MVTIDTPTKRILADPKKRARWVVYQLSIQGKSLASVARNAGVKRQQPSKALREPYPKAEAIIARELGMTPQQLFPERYDEFGLPKRKTPGRKRGVSSPKDTSAHARGNVNRRSAA